MTKYYTMKECFDACDDNDIPFIEGGFNSTSQFTKKKLIISPITTQFATEMIGTGLSDQWQIKKADPVVLSYKEYVENKGMKYLLDEKFCYEKGDQNGQTREWLRPEQVELRKTVKYLADSISDNYTYRTKLENALKNLKPPYENQ